ncbi:uncharacterized protein O3C94_021542 [Discoglossus pictus]
MSNRHLTKSSLMNQDKKMSERILHHILEILSLLTGKVSVLKHLTVIEMDKDREMSEMILSHTLEIIYLVTGEEYTIVRKPSHHIHHLTEQCDPDGNKETFGISSHRCSGLQSDNVDPVSEEGVDEMDEKDILPVMIQSELSAGLQSGNMDTISVIKEEEDERDDQDIHQVEICLGAGLHDEHLDIVSVIKKDEDDRDDKDIVQVTIHSDICTDVSMTSNVYEEHQMSLLSSDCVREDFSVSHRYMDASQSCVKHQNGEKNLCIF